MKAHDSLNQESLQQFLADAFAVQNCGLDRESLYDLIELERFTATDDFDEVRALQLVAERTLKVANAGGVSIAVLQGNELVYRAGSGSAASDVGHRVPAVLSVSQEAEARKEILRVENAPTDTRVEADVCRQFGATSLLMLPIYQDRALTGVMQVLFDDAHKFVDREMRTYRLMVGVLEERILSRPQRTQQQSAKSAGRQIACDRSNLQYQLLNHAKPLLIVPDVVEQNNPPQGSPRTGDDREVHVVRTPIRSWGGLVVSKLITSSKELKAAVWNVDRPLNVHFWRRGTIVTMAILLAIAIWASHHNRPAPVINSLAISTVRGTEQHASGQPLFTNNTTKQASNKRRDTAAPNSAFRRVRIGPSEVDYVAEDVTIRHFNTVPARPQTLSSKKEVNFGDDVTVRYFAYAPTAVATPRPSSAATAATKHVMPVSR